MKLKILLLACGTAAAITARLAEGSALADEAAQDCARTPAVLTPVYYAPRNRSTALAAARGERPNPQARPALAFRLEGIEPCRENGCRLRILDERESEAIATINIDHRDVRYCRSAEVLEAEKGAPALCAAPSLNVSSLIELKGDGRDPAVEDVAILIDFQYFLGEGGKRSLFSNLFGAWQKQAAQCRSLGTIAEPRARVGAWKITSRIGAVTTIYETDRLRPTGDFRDYDLGKLSVSAPFADPVPLAKNADATGARQMR